MTPTRLGLIDWGGFFVGMTDRIRQCLGTPVNGASLAVFRIFFGLAVFASVWKYVDPDSSAFMTFYTFPEWNFPYPGLEWVRPVPPAFLKGVFVLLAIACLCLAAGIVTIQHL